MKRIVKRLSLLLSVLLLFAAFSLFASAETEQWYGGVVQDDAGLFSTFDRDRLEKKLDALGNEHRVALAVLTTRDYEELYTDPTEGMDQFYYDCGMPDNGLLFVISFERTGSGRYMYLSNGRGSAISLGQEERDYIFDSIRPQMHDGDYVGACETLFDRIESYFSAEESGEEFIQKQFIFETNWIIIALVVGLIVGLIVTGTMKAKLKTVRSKEQANDYMRQGSMHIDRQADIYLYRNVSRTERPRNNSSGGHSTSSSSGRSGRSSF